MRDLCVLAILPAVLGVTFGLLGPAVPVVDLPTAAVLTVAVLAVPVVCTYLTVSRADRAAAPSARRTDA